jgi:hypothetical protein
MRTCRDQPTPTPLLARPAPASPLPAPGRCCGCCTHGSQAVRSGEQKHTIKEFRARRHLRGARVLVGGPRLRLVLDATVIHRSAPATTHSLIKEREREQYCDQRRLIRVIRVTRVARIDREHVLVPSASQPGWLQARAIRDTVLAPHTERKRGLCNKESRSGWMKESGLTREGGRESQLDTTVAHSRAKGATRTGGCWMRGWSVRSEGWAYQHLARHTQTHTHLRTNTLTHTQTHTNKQVSIIQTDVACV